MGYGAPGGAGVIFTVDYTETNMRHPFVLELLDADGEPVALPGPFGPQPVRVEQAVEVGRPAGMPHGEEQLLPFAINHPPLPLALGRSFEWRLTIDDDVDHAISLRFRTRRPEELPPGVQPLSAE